MKKFWLSCLAIIISLLFGALILWLMGKDPIAAYTNLLQGSGLMHKARYAGRQSMFTDFMSFIDAMTPMIFASLSVALALKGGFFNIGVSGQMMAAGITAHILAGFIPSRIVVVLAGFLAGALIGALIGWLRYRFNVSEVVSSIMLNSILMYLITFYINTFYINPVSRQSKSIVDAARLTISGFRWEKLKVDIALAFPLALSVAEKLGANPMPFVVCICFAASSAFSTPIGYQTNLIVQGVGGYKFSDFVKVGLPMNIIVFVLSVLLIPIFYHLV